MATQIYKYDIWVTDNQIIQMKKNTVIRKVAYQDGQLRIWAEHDVNEYENTNRRFRIFGTGHEIRTDAGELKFLETVFDPNGYLVWHVYEVISGY